MKKEKEVFPDEGCKHLLCLILKEMAERLNSRKLRGFKEIESGNYHTLLGEFLQNKEDTMDPLKNKKNWGNYFRRG